MRLCVAQTKPVKGDLIANMASHKQLVLLAARNYADIIIFPELSLTGYEPALARELAIAPEDHRLDEFQQLSDVHRMVIGIGVPLKSKAGITVSMVLFQPYKQREVYSKKYLHMDEYPYFVSSEELLELKVNGSNVALAICYELSVPEHAERAYQNGASIYMASVAKHASGVENAIKSLSDIAHKYSMTVVMSNSVGPSDNFIGAGKSSAWNSHGMLLGQLDDSNEGILVMDIQSEKTVIVS